MSTSSVAALLVLAALDLDSGLPEVGGESGGRAVQCGDCRQVLAGWWAATNHREQVMYCQYSAEWLVVGGDGMVEAPCDDEINLLFFLRD